MITPAMIEAGAAALRECKEGLDEAEKALIVFEAMTAAAPVEETAPEPTPVPDKTKDAEWIMANQDRYSAEQIKWARGILGLPDGEAPTPVPPIITPSPTPTGTKIASQAELDKALADTAGGKTLLLAGSFNINIAREYASEMVITSADPKAKAKIGSAKIKGSKVTLRGLEIGRSASEATRESQFMLTIEGGNITIEGNHFHGSLDDDPRNDGVGYKLWSTGNVRIINNEFEQLGRCGVNSGTGILIRGNHCHDIRSEGFQSSNVTDITIEDNLFEKWKRASADHPDAIQFMTAGANRGSSKIVIRHNVILCNVGDGAQGIFLRDEVGGLPYTDLTIENNFVLGKNMANGIYVDGGKNVTVRNNTVVSPTDDSNPVWISLKNISGLTQSGNIADQGGQKTPAQVFTGAQMALLTTARYAEASPEKLFVSGIGAQLA